MKISGVIVALVDEKKFHSFTWRLLAGFETGMAAAVLMAAYAFAQNLLFQTSPWHAPRLFGGLFAAATGWHFSPALSLLMGYSLLLLVSGIQGLLFGAIISPRVGSIWSGNLGVFFSLGWYLVVLRHMVWNWDPARMLRFTQPWLLLGFFLFGAVFIAYPSLHHRISRPVVAAGGRMPSLPAGTDTPPAPSAHEAPPIQAREAD